MMEDPVDIPVAIPVTESIEATAGVLLLHLPPAIALYIGFVCPIQMNLKPVIAATGFTVTVFTTKSPPTE
jgi:hypothetical protein